MKTDRIVSISAIVVAIGTLIMIVYQTHLTRQIQQASVLPYLQIGFSQSNDYAAIRLANRGVGPALIESIRVLRDGKEYQGDPYEYFSKVIEPSDIRSGLYIDRIFPGMIIPAGNTIEMIGVQESPETLSELVRTFSVNGIDADEKDDSTAVIEITYSSVYGKQWKILSNEIVPTPN